jgi:hypothetical protein
LHIAIKVAAIVIAMCNCRAKLGIIFLHRYQSALNTEITTTSTIGELMFVTIFNFFSSLATIQCCTVG